MKNAISIISLALLALGFIYALGTAGHSDVGLIVEFKNLVIRMGIALLMMCAGYVGLRLTIN